MKSASFFFPFESTFKLLNSILKAKGYTITESNITEGTIKAHKSGLFKKKKILDIQLLKTDQNTTQLKLMINGNHHINGKPLNLDSREEEKLMDSIHKHF